MNKLLEFFLITAGSYYLFTQFHHAYDDREPKKKSCVDVECQTEITSVEIEDLFKFKKDMDDIDNGMYVWNII